VRYEEGGRKMVVVVVVSETAWMDGRWDVPRWADTNAAAGEL
jgi:hypothetical protein